jgi:hypothetical protein
LLAPRPTPKLEDHPSSAVRGCLFNLFTATLHIGGRSSIRNRRTRHAVVTGTHIHTAPVQGCALPYLYNDTTVCSLSYQFQTCHFFRFHIYRLLCNGRNMGAMVRRLTQSNGKGCGLTTARRILINTMMGACFLISSAHLLVIGWNASSMTYLCVMLIQFHSVSTHYDIPTNNDDEITANLTVPSETRTRFKSFLVSDIQGDLLSYNSGR